MRKRFGTSVLVWAAMLALGTQPFAAQQSGTPPTAGAPASQDQYTFRTVSDLVLVNLVVRDKQGQPVRGLKASDFTVLEDGKQQQVMSFDVEDVTSERAAELAPVAPTSSGAAASAPAKAAAAKTPSVKFDARNRRLIVLFFDFTGMEPEDLERSVASAQKFVSQQMAPGDVVAVVSFKTELRADQDFTSDKELLLKALGHYSRASGAGYEAGATGDSGDASDTGFTPDDSDFNTFNTDRKLQALQSLSEALSSIPQRKSVIYFSSGVTRNGVENQTRLRASINAAIQSNVAIYAVSATGLVALPPGGEAQAASLRGTSAYSGAGVRQQYDQSFAATETLTTLANDTGGKAFLDTNDFSGAFRKVQEDTSAYYVIGYRSTNRDRDGRFRKITVRTALKDVKLDYRSGYYVGRDFVHAGKQEREEQLQTELDNQSPAMDVTVYVSAAFFRLDAARFFVPVSVVIPGREIPFVQGGDQDKATLDVLGQVRDPVSKLPIASVRETVKLAIEQSRNVARKNVQYNTGFLLAPGDYQVKFVVRENQTGRMGSFEASITVPNLSKTPKNKPVPTLKMSSVVISNRLAPAAKPVRDNPLFRNGQELVPNITHVFSSDQHLYVYYEVYDPAKAQPAPAAEASAKNAPAPKNPVRLLGALQLFRDEVKAFETPLLEVDSLSPERRAGVFQMDVPLEKLRPGYYICQLTIVDDAAGTFAFPRFPILIKPPVNPSVAATSSK
jgi:VWFA-related protein